jgi:hypothetical protein
MGVTVKRLLLGIIASCLACAGFAIDGNVICTKAVNIQDQWTGILRTQSCCSGMRTGSPGRTVYSKCPVCLAFSQERQGMCFRQTAYD